MIKRASDQGVPQLGPEAYAKWRATRVGAVTERLEWQLLLELIGDVRGRRVLDLVCGDGALTMELWKRGGDVIGIDPSRSMIDAASARAEAQGAEIRFCMGRAEHLPIAAGSVDVVVAMTILCFIEDAVPAFQEIERVLRPGGRLVIGELGKWSSWAAARRVRAWLGSPLWRVGRFRTPGELRALAERGGLIPGEVRGAIYYPNFGPAARFLAPIDAGLGRVTNLGAAFLALSAEKPAENSAP